MFPFIITFSLITYTVSNGGGIAGITIWPTLK